jgi:hypothetical protein
MVDWAFQFYDFISEKQTPLPSKQIKEGLIG